MKVSQDVLNAVVNYGTGDIRVTKKRARQLGFKMGDTFQAVCRNAKLNRTLCVSSIQPNYDRTVSFIVINGRSSEKM